MLNVIIRWKNFTSAFRISDNLEAKPHHDVQGGRVNSDIGTLVWISSRFSDFTPYQSCCKIDLEIGQIVRKREKIADNILSKPQTVPKTCTLCL